MTGSDGGTTARPGAEAVDGDSLDVLVVAYKSERTLPALLESVATRLPAGTRVLIWSNSDTAPLERVAAATRAELPGLRLEILGDGSNLGFAKACNALAEHSDRANVLFLNPDARVVRWPTGAYFHERAMLAPLVFDSTGTWQPSYGSGRSVWDEIALRLLRRPLAPPPPPHPFPVAFASGVALLVRREEFLACAGFDESYFMYYEDIDLGQRWHRSGGRVIVDPDFRIEHIGGASSRENRLEALQRSQRSAEAYHRRWSRWAWLFRVTCVVEALLKSGVALVRGRVGSIDRRTQLRFTRFLLSRDRAS